MWQHWQLLKWFFLTYTILTGLHALQYDFGIRKFQQTKLLQIYAIIYNIFMLLLLPIHFLYSLEDIELYEAFPLAKPINLICAVVRTVAVFSALIMRGQYESCLSGIIAELQHIEENYFRRIATIPAQRLRLLNSLLYGKFLAWILLTSYAIFSILQQWWLGRLFKKSITFVIVECLNIQQVLEIQHYVILWHICKRYYIVNDQLTAVLEMSCGSHLGKSLAKQLAALDLCVLSAIHAKLTRLLVHMNDIFKFKLLMVVLSYFVNFVSIGYQLALLSSINFKYWSLAGMLLSSALYALLLFNIFLLMLLSEHIVEISEKMSCILRQSIGLATFGRDFERSSEMLSLQLLGRQIARNIFGYFDINRRTIFAVLLQISLYTIFLVQSDYKSLYYKKPENKTEL